MAYVTDFRTSNPSLLRGRVHAIVESFRKAREQRKIYKRTLAELEILTPRELDDLGISPLQIRIIAREAAAMVK